MQALGGIPEGAHSGSVVLADSHPRFNLVLENRTLRVNERDFIVTRLTRLQQNSVRLQIRSKIFLFLSRPLRPKWHRLEVLEIYVALLRCGKTGVRSAS
jgi:hypothetical protein